MKDFKLEKDYEYDFQEDILTINASMYVEDYILLKKFLKYFKVYPLELRITPKEHKIHCEYVCAWYNIPGDKNE